jgi:hypothetical protein
VPEGVERPTDRTTKRLRRHISLIKDSSDLCITSETSPSSGLEGSQSKVSEASRDMGSREDCSWTLILISGVPFV